MKLPDAPLPNTPHSPNKCVRSNRKSSRRRLTKPRRTPHQDLSKTGHSGAGTTYVSYSVQANSIERCTHTHRTLPDAVSCIGNAPGFIRAINRGKERPLDFAERERVRQISNVNIDEASLLLALFYREQELSREDFLTGVLNERGFMETLEAEIKRSRRYSHPITVIYVDLDSFKAVNDGPGGHDEGDHVLRVVARTMQTSVREVDYVARLHGDEFCLLLPETDSESVPRILHKLKKSLDEAMFAMHWPVSFSIGAITTNTAAVSSDVLMHEADKMMYKAKQSGKDRFEYRILESNVTGVDKVQSTSQTVFKSPLSKPSEKSLEVKGKS